MGKISRTIDLDEITLAANEIRQIDLSPVTRLIGSKILTDTGIELEHSGRPGAMIAAAASTDHSTEGFAEPALLL